MPLQLRSTITSDGRLELSLADVDMPQPDANEVVVRIEASPINPSDMGLLFGAADMSTAETTGPAGGPVVSAAIPEGLLETSLGDCAGTILSAARGEDGFGYDPVFEVEGTQLTMAELPKGRKNEISHRARALNALFEGL